MLFFFFSYSAQFCGLSSESWFYGFEIVIALKDHVDQSLPNQQQEFTSCSIGINHLKQIRFG